MRVTEKEYTELLKEEFPDTDWDDIPSIDWEMLREFEDQEPPPFSFLNKRPKDSEED